MVRNGISLLLFLLWGSVQLHAQALTLLLPDTTIGEDETVQLVMQARDFDDIASIQFSINWDVSIIEYLGEQEYDLQNVAIGDVDADQGILRLSWFPPTGQPLSLPDDSNLLGLDFRAVGMLGDVTNVTLTDNPLAIQITQATGVPNEFVEIDLEQQEGVVRIGDALGLTIEVENIGCFGAADGAVTINFTDFPDGGSILWNGPNNFTSTATELSNLAPGNYELTVFDADNNVVLNTMIPVEAPTEPLQVDTVLVTPTGCVSPIGTAMVEVSGGGMPYRFQLEGEVMPPVSTEGNFQDLPAGVYTINVTDDFGCTTSYDFDIPGPPVPQVNLGGNQSLCPDEETTLDAGSGFVSYSWSTGSTSPTITIDATGTYSVTVTDELGCTGSDMVEITPGEDLELIIENDLLEICPGDSIDLMVSGANFYAWTDTSQTLNTLQGPEVTARPSVTTSYRVVGSNSCKTDTATLEVLVFETEATAGPDTCIILGEEMELDASGGIVYIWEPNFEFPVSDPTIPNPTISPDDTTNYTITIVDENSCVTIDTVMVAVLQDLGDIKAINLITPNGDGKNDVLEFQGLGKLRENTLKVFNRWGDQVYDKINYQSDTERFDGTYRGKELPAGTYFYVLSFRTGEIKQTLTIVRE